LLLASKVGKGTMLVRIEVKGWMVVQIRGNHNIATENQYISTFVIVDKTIRKFQM
jgi:predicted RNA binding protein YcfA (HicA-like mRNA interferase family)